MSGPGRIEGDEVVLSRDEVAAFQRDGYVVVAGVLSEAELATLEPVFDAFVRADHATRAAMGRDFCDMSGPYDRAFEDFQLVNAMLPRVYEPALAGNVFERRAASIARQLIGEDATLDYDQFLAKRPRKPLARFPWHQDLGYWPTGTPDTRTATCSLALDDATPRNGCLRVVPGSQREPSLRPHRPVHLDAEGARDGGHPLEVTLRPTDRVVEIPVPRGGVSVHDERIVHGSAGNETDGWRRTYVVAHRSRATVAHERSIGFTHSHEDRIDWTTCLEALDADDEHDEHDD